jgi:hypothetical protein
MSSNPGASKILLPLSITSIAALTVGMLCTGFMGIATLSYGLLVTGLINKSKREIHARFMTLGIFIDLGLVLTLELQRNAVNTAVQGQLLPIQMAHIGFSSLATALYIPVFVIGVTLLKKPHLRNKLRKIHLQLGGFAMLFRTIGWFLMFSMLLPKSS